MPEAASPRPTRMNLSADSPVLGQGQGCHKAVAVQAPSVRAHVAREVRLDLRLAFRGVVLCGLAVQPACQICGDGEQGRCLRLCARSLENHPSLCAQP